MPMTSYGTVAGSVFAQQGFRQRPLLTSVPLSLALKRSNNTVVLNQQRTTSLRHKRPASAVCSSAAADLSLPTPDGGE